MALQVTASTPTTLSPNTVTNWCAYNAHGIRIAVIFPYDGGFAVANHHYGGYPVRFAALADAQRSVEIRHPYLARWERTEVPQ